MNPLEGLPHECILLDACCAINVSVSGYAEEILAATGKSVAIATYVMEHELKQTSVASAISTLVGSQQLTVVSPSDDDENSMYVELASLNLDNGEAVTGAIASKRNWAVATDERKARAVFTQRLPGIVLLTTPELLYHWAARTLPTPEFVSAALRNIRKDGHYQPSIDHPLREWWLGWQSNGMS